MADPIVDTPLPEPGSYRILSSVTYMDDDGLEHIQYSFIALTLAEAKAEKQGELDAIYAAKLETGYPCVLGGQADSLQTRESDKVNWLTFKDACQDMIDLGAGEVANPQPVRTTSNRNVTVTANEGKALMIAMRGWFGATMLRHWQLSDAIAQAANYEELDAIALTGWPS